MSYQILTFLADDPAVTTQPGVETGVVFLSEDTFDTFEDAENALANLRRANPALSFEIVS